MKTWIPISPVDLYRIFAGTDAKALVSFQAITALNIHLGGDKNISKKAFNEFLRNLTFQALSKENNSIFMSYEGMGNFGFRYTWKLIKNWKSIGWWFKYIKWKIEITAGSNKWRIHQLN